jgi:hypothetical protein
MACLALHNFICESNLCDKEFERCDNNENYLVESVDDDDDDDDDDDEEEEEEEEESQDVENGDTMNIIHTRIADALVSTSVG